MVGFNGSNIAHAMILAGVERNIAGVEEYIFKNSYGKGNTTDLLKKEFVHVPIGSPTFSQRNVLLIKPNQYRNILFSLFIIKRNKVDLVQMSSQLSTGYLTSLSQYKL